MVRLQTFLACLWHPISSLLCCLRTQLSRADLEFVLGVAPLTVSRFYEVPGGHTSEFAAGSNKAKPFWSNVMFTGTKVSKKFGG